VSEGILFNDGSPDFLLAIQGVLGDGAYHMNSKRPDPTLKRFVEQINAVDKLSVVILKGDLLIEEALDRITKKFVHHGDHLEKADPRFFQLVAIARSMSLDDQDNSMWNLILAINGLRNQLAHSLDTAKRRAKFDRLKTLYLAEAAGAPAPISDANLPDHKLAMYAVAMSLGFLASFKEEVDRFRHVVAATDRAMNPHRAKRDV
jgi:hypothetical protein